MEKSDDVIISTQQANSFINSVTSGSSSNGDINYGSLINSSIPNLSNLTNSNANNSNSPNSSNNNNNSNNNSNNINGSNTERPPNAYTMPGILHFLQHEWNRFEYERQQWDTERAELLTKISFLQGERRGQENLKNSLIRRIKMLELALKQERTKFHKLKYGTEPPEFKSNNPNSLTNENQDSNDLDNNAFSIDKHPILNKENTSSTAIKQGRHLLKQYLQEIGYTDSVIDIRSARLRSLLGLSGAATTTNQLNKQAFNNINDPIDILSTNNFNNNQQQQQQQSTADSIAQLLLNGAANNNNNNNSNNTRAKQLLQLSSNKKNVNGSAEVTTLNNNLMNGCEKGLKLSDAEPSQIIIMSSNNKKSGGKSKKKSRSSKERFSVNGDADEDDEDDDEGGDEDEDDEIMMDDESKSSSSDQIDADTEDALNEFDFLSNEKSSASSSMSSDSAVSSSSNQSESLHSTSGGDWDMDKNQLNELTEQYKKERKSAKASPSSANNKSQISINNRPNRSTLQAMIANLADNSDSDQTEKHENNSASNSSISSSSSDTQKLNTIAFSNNTNPKLFLEEDSFGMDSSNLGELSRISVNNNNLSMNMSGLNVLNDETLDSQRKVITTKFSLRGHFDSVRCLAFHPTESALLTGSEDQTIKLWNLDKSSALSNKKNSNTDIEPVYTFRKHMGPILSLVVSANGDHCISSSLDSKVIVWNMPNFETSDQYDQYNPNVFMKYLNGHTDAVWNMALVDNTLVTVSADSTLRIWNPFSIDELDETATTSISCLNEDKSEGIPTSVDFINSESSRIIASFGSTHHSLYDIETSKLLHKFDFHDPQTNTHCYKVISHPATGSPSSSLIISAHEDKQIRFFDINSGKLVYQMVAHQEACTDIAIDPTCFYLLSASHDCSIRLWNLDTRNCVQELTSHRKKYDEAINCVAFHPTKPFIASGGADAIVKIYV